MITKIKAFLNNPQLWQVIVTAILTYFGYVEVEQRMREPNIPEVSAQVPVQVVVPRPVQKDWTSTIQKMVDEGIAEHSDEFHGGG